MYNLIKQSIRRGGYQLADMSDRIAKFAAAGRITPEEMEQLMILAAGNAAADAERPEVLKMVQALYARMEAAEARITVLEGGGDTAGGETGSYPAWVPWDGMSSNYQPGAIVTHGGETWISVYSGQNVWEPGAQGTEAMWQAYAGEEAAQE